MPESTDNTNKNVDDELSTDKVNDKLITNDNRKSVGFPHDLENTETQLKLAAEQEILASRHGKIYNLIFLSFL